MDASEREVFTLADLRAGWPQAPDRIRLSVMGDPVAHSASPPMHNAALRARGLAMRYTRLHIRPGELGEALRLLPSRGFIGTNLTIPHKAAALPLVDSVDADARRLGVINTVRVEAGRRLRGFNTDGPGFVRAVRAEFGAELRGLRVLMLGAGGGAGRAIAIQCALEGCGALLLANRTRVKAQALAEELRTLSPGVPRCRAVDLEGAGIPGEEIDLVVNATSVGLGPDDPSALGDTPVAGHWFVLDTVYRRDGQLTRLVADARAAGARAADGRSLLLHQGALSFEIWFGRPAPLEEMAAGLAAAFA